MTGRRGWLAAAAIAVVTIGTTVALSGQPAQASTGLEGVPHFDHVVVLTEENESSAFAAGSAATFLNSLVPQGVFLPNYYGTGHVSLDNYLAMVSGQPGNVLSNTDCLTVSLWTCAQLASSYNGGQQLGDQLEAHGISWNSFMDATSVPCFHGPYKPLDLAPDPYQGDSTKAPAFNYADRHNPFVYFKDFVTKPARCAAHQLPYTDLSAALAGGPSSWTAATLPAFSFIAPDTCHDGHDSPCADKSPGGLPALDAWLRTNLPPLVQYLDSHNGLLVINFDESAIPPPAGLCTTCVSLGLGGRTGALLLGAGLAAGRTDATGYDHYSLLRTIEDSFAITTHLGLAARAKPISAAFAP